MKQYFMVVSKNGINRLTPVARKGPPFGQTEFVAVGSYDKEWLENLIKNGEAVRGDSTYKIPESTMGNLLVVPEGEVYTGAMDVVSDTLESLFD